MNISLTKALTEFVDRELSTGQYASASEVIRDALRLLIAHRTDGRAALAEDEIERGLGIVMDDAYFERKIEMIRKLNQA